MPSIIQRIRNAISRGRNTSSSNRSSPQTTGGMSTPGGSVLVTPSGQRVGTASIPTTPTPNRSLSGKSGGSSRASSTGGAGGVSYEGDTTVESAPVTTAPVNRRISPAKSGAAQPTVTEMELKMSLPAAERNLPPDFVRRRQSIQSEYEPVGSGASGGVLVRSRYTGDVREVFPLQTSAYSISGSPETGYGEIYGGGMQPTPTERRVNASLPAAVRTQDLSSVDTSSFYVNGVRNGQTLGLSNSSNSGYLNRVGNPVSSQKTGFAGFVSGYTSVIRSAFDSPKNFAIATGAVGVGIGAAILAPEIAAAAGVVAIGGGIAYSGYKLIREPTAYRLGEFAFAATPLGVSGAVKGIGGALRLPRTSSIFLSRASTVSASEGGYIVESQAVVNTVQTRAFSNSKFLTFLRTRSFYTVEGNQFTGRSGTLGVTQEEAGLNLLTGKSVMNPPRRVGAASVSQGYVSDDGYLAASAIKSQVAGSTPVYSASMSGGTKINENLIFSAGRSVPYVNGKLTQANRGVFAGFTEINAVSNVEGTGFTVFRAGRGGTGNALKQISESQLASIANNIAPRTGYINTGPVTGAAGGATLLSQTQIRRAESAYYGTGSYERTDTILVTTPRGTRTMSKTQIISYEALSYGNAPRTAQPQVISQRPRSRSGFGNFAINTGAQVQLPRAAVLPRAGMGQALRVRLLTGQGSTTRPPVVLIPYVPYVPYSPGRGFNLGNLAELGLGAKALTGGRSASRYVPSYSALVFNIGGSYGRNSLRGSGLDFRPVTRGFRFIRGNARYLRF